MVQFLEDYPLYKKAKLDVDIEYLNYFKASARPIQKNCLNCGIECTFSLEKINNEYPGTNINYSNDTTSLNYPYLLSYKCAKCSSFKYSFLVLVLEDEDDDTFCVQKIGQNPPYSVQPEESMVKYLNKEGLSLYKNGIILDLRRMDGRVPTKRFVDEIERQFTQNRSIKHAIIITRQETSIDFKR